jgi:hypothetical protein
MVSKTFLQCADADVTARSDRRDSQGQMRFLFHDFDGRSNCARRSPRRFAHHRVSVGMLCGEDEPTYQAVGKG